MHAASEAPAGVAFGRFLLLPHRRELLADGQPVKLGGRAFDVLMALIDAHGAAVSKNALMARVWPDRIVEENNLQWQISTLRTALGADRNLIRTVPGRGYQFTAEIDTVSGRPEADAGTGIATAPPELPSTNLPEPISELIGRDDVLGEILNLAAVHRLVTLTGAGGIGKTRLALAAARRLLPQFADGVWLAEFSPIADPELLPVTVAAAIGLNLGGGVVTTQRVSRALAGRRLLLVLDTCEHVIGAAAALAEAVLRAGGTLRLLATSREPLRAEGEWVYPVPPLAVPAEDAEDPDDLLRYGGVRLFAERLRAAEPHFAPDRRSAALIAAICRRLDGIPLAIELAAARAAVLGVEEVATHLDDRFRILTGGRRTALPRHQTLRATLDWSYELLSEPERVILRRLAVFSGGFRLEAASTVIASPEIAPADIVDGIANLVAKSLVTVVAGSAVALYRLLDTMRAYGLDQLAESGEREVIARRHAEYYRELFEAAEAERETRPRAEWLNDYGRQIDNLRTALDWAFSPGGDATIGAGLAAASVPIWFELSLLGECRSWAENALGSLDAAGRTPKSEMVLQYALGYSLMAAHGMNDRARTALTRVSELAEQLADLDYRLRALAGLASICHRLEDLHGAIAFGRQAEEAVKGSSDPILGSIADWILGASLQLLAEYSEALTYAERTYDRTAEPAVRRAHITRLGRDSCISAGSTVALIRWTQGLPDQAAQIAQSVLADAEAGDHPLSLCLALTWCGCLISLRRGQLETAERAIARLKDQAQSHGLSAYYANGLSFEGQLTAKRGDAVAAERLLRAGLANLRQTQSETLYTAFLSGLAEVLMASHQLDEALAAADEALQRTERNNALWWMPEAIRVKGEVLLFMKGGTKLAEDHFRRSMNLAARHGALSWELRAGTSLAGLLRDQGWPADAMALLQPVYDRFTEGFDTVDLKMAKALLDALQ
ncbi:MAG TPA: winged helix-turn-helix domain-containing protein [Stellaceae bacterium]|jgi:predicted ATPase/DNA-binding winged helix-turn-helix (wHTH) protein|nr:winged helix-turn-helix domain-containing protein [Stellaceae bacterium]